MITIPRVICAQPQMTKQIQVFHVRLHVCIEIIKVLHIINGVVVGEESESVQCDSLCINSKTFIVFAFDLFQKKVKLNSNQKIGKFFNILNKLFQIDHYI